MAVQLVSLKAEVGAFHGSEVLTHAFGMVAVEGVHPGPHFGSWVVEVEELLPDWEVLGLGGAACYSVKKGTQRWVEEARGLGQALVSSDAKNCVSVAALGLTHLWDWRVH